MGKPMGHWTMQLILVEDNERKVYIRGVIEYVHT